MGKLDSIEFLKIRILVSLLKMSPENCNVTWNDDKAGTVFVETEVKNIR